MFEPAWVHGAWVEHELAQGGEPGFGEETGVANPGWPDLNQAAVEHGSGGWGRFGFALLGAGLPGPEQQAVGDLRSHTELDTEFLAQPGARSEFPILCVAAFHWQLHAAVH